MTNKIATKQYCNTIQSNSFTDDLTRCPRHEDIVNVGLLVTGLYRADQLIPEDVISANINYITVSATRVKAIQSLRLFLNIIICRSQL